MLSPYPFPKARMDYFPDTPERLSKVKRLLLVDGDLKLANGLELYLTPGHSRGGQTIVGKYERYFNSSRHVSQVFNDVLGFRAFCDSYNSALALTSTSFSVADFSRGQGGG